jgi:hypothetical protein
VLEGLLIFIHSYDLTFEIAIPLRGLLNTN